MVSVRIYEGSTYVTPKGLNNQYVRIEWSTGYVDMQKYHFDKLSKKKIKNLLSAK